MAHISKLPWYWMWPQRRQSVFPTSVSLFQSAAPLILDLFSLHLEGSHSFFPYELQPSVEQSSGGRSPPSRSSIGFKDHHSGTCYSPKAPTLPPRLILLPPRKTWSFIYSPSFLTCDTSLLSFAGPSPPLLKAHPHLTASNFLSLHFL